MPRLFDAYLIADWSASSKPVRGANSIWVGVLECNARSEVQFTSINLSTRNEARTYITDKTKALIARGDKLLIGVDFALGYPAGTAQAIGLDTSCKKPWRAMHDYLSSHVRDERNNSNDRFVLAAELNKAMTGGPHPFWGVPKTGAASTLAPTKGDFSNDGVSETRLAERWVKQTFKANPKSVWQLLGAGAVGSQALLGIPTVSYLRAQLPNTRIWPFETGFQPLTNANLTGTDCIIAEVYPSTVEITLQPNEVLDEAQVKALCYHFYTLDKTGTLAATFGPAKSLTSKDIYHIEAEEGWILAK